jgi:hypothetical protein
LGRKSSRIATPEKRKAPWIRGFSSSGGRI